MARSLFAGGSNGAIVFDLHSGEKKSLDVNHPQAARWISFNQILVSDHDGKLGIVDVEVGEFVSVFQNQNHDANHIAPSPNGETIVTANQREVTFWHARSGRLLGTIEVDSELESIGFSPDGAKLYYSIRNVDDQVCEVRVVNRLVPSRL